MLWLEVERRNWSRSTPRYENLRNVLAFFFSVVDQNPISIKSSVLHQFRSKMLEVSYRQRQRGPIMKLLANITHPNSWEAHVFGISHSCDLSMYA